jgi:uncharacterized protein YecE (DUF72 family)
VPSPGRVWIGTSGFSYRHWRGGVFYPAGLVQRQELEYYARHFDTLELNNSFYRLPTVERFAAWRDRTPAHFVFAVKASRFITHIRRLRGCREAVDLLLTNARALGPKLGPILFQLPADIARDCARLREFLSILPRDLRFVFEFRNPAWLVEPVHELLRAHDAAICLAVNALAPAPQPQLTASFSYLRMHVGGGPEGAFTEPELRHWSQVIGKLRDRGADLYVYFNNDWRGFAIADAQRLRKLLTAGGQAKSRSSTKRRA